MLLVGWQEKHPACKNMEWWDAGMVICLEWGIGANDFNMVHLMPLLPCHLLLQQNPECFILLVPAYQVVLEKKTVILCFISYKLFKLFILFYFTNPVTLCCLFICSKLKILHVMRERRPLPKNITGYHLFSLSVNRAAALITWKLAKGPEIVDPV